MIKKWFKRTVLIVGALLVFAMPAQAVDYEMEIFNVPGSDFCPAYSINNDGDIVGPVSKQRNREWYVYFGDYYFRTYDKAPLNATSVVAQGINSDGVVVGWHYEPGDPTIGFIYDTSVNPSYRTIQQCAGCMLLLYDVADDGTAVGHGTYPNATDNLKGLIYNNGTWSVLVHPAGEKTTIRGISSDGQLIVGTYMAPDTVYPYRIKNYPYYYDGSQFMDLPEYPGSSNTQYSDINSHGVASGTRHGSGSTMYGFTYNVHTGVFTDLPTSWYGKYYAGSINDNGDVAGHFSDYGNTYAQAAIWRVVEQAPPPPPPPTEAAVEIAQFKLVKNISNDKVTYSVVIHGEAMPETFEALVDGSILSGVEIRLVLPGLGEDGLDLILIDIIDAVVKSTPATVHLNK